MTKYNRLYFRDGVEMSHKDWWNALNADIDAIQKKHKYCQVKSAIHTDVNNGRNIIVNQHAYSQRVDEVCCTAKEVISQMLRSGRVDPILNVVEKMSESAAHDLVSKLDIVECEDGKYTIVGEEC